MLENCILDFDRRDVLASGDDHILLAVGDHDVVIVVDDSTVTGVEESAADRRICLVWLLPVPGHDRVAPGQDFALGIDSHRRAEARRTSAGQFLRPLKRRELVVLDAIAVDRDQRCRFGQTVDLDELPAEFDFGPLDRGRGRGSAGHDDSNAFAPGDRLTGGCQLGGCVEDRIKNGGCTADQRHAVLLDASQDLVPVDLADDDMFATHCAHRIEHSPTVAMELGEGVQIYVSVRHAHVPAEGGGIDPHIAVGQLNTLRACRRA